MTLVFLYGPPAAGKLTVARLVSEQTGFPLFHNHLSVDLLLPVFGFGTPSFGKLAEQIRLLVFEEAAAAKLPGLVFTFVYATPHDDTFVDGVMAAVERHGGQVVFVQLTCDRASLDERVTAASRKAYRKLASVETLGEILDQYDLFQPVKQGSSLRLDSGKLSPEESAAAIFEHIRSISGHE